jgi:hypothetical protein
MRQPLCGHALEGIFDRYFLCGLLDLPLRHRVNGCSQQLARLGVAFPGQRQRNIGVFPKGHELFLAAKPIGPAPELPAGRLDPEVKSSSIAHAVGSFRRLGFFNLRICQSGHPIPPRSRKVHPLKKQNTPKSTPGRTRLHLDAPGRRKT